ncbi:DUF4105 domain-containing protein [Pedobacter steynii]|uniref:Lnb N-terminal periplasmic domain-containing protein n=1 Tax=Pedobacter steynii TaxID=430522 RepID=A0A1D7QGR1_9SPHI|nr:DUF4105 domain-containing protein [Pedobacter steynii]AOM77850.1 hypothetical protein BFS30_12105 [Pedobacter steynii]
MSRSNRFLLLTVIFLLCQKVSTASQKAPVANFSVSLLTCEKTDRYIYALFGHSAIRIKSNNNQSDLVYNYGTFDTGDPKFYVNFLHGQMRYFLSVTEYQTFIQSYIVDEQSVTEQVLQLNESQKNKLLSLLQEQIKPQNRSYNYDFVKQNCSTKIIDLLSESLGPDFDQALLKLNAGKGPPVRDLLNVYLRRQEFEMIGMNSLLGRRSDTITNKSVSLFLPDTLQKTMDKIQLGTIKLSAPIVYLFKSQHQTASGLPVFYLLSYGLNLFFVLGISAGLSAHPQRYSVPKKLISFLDGFFILALSTLGLLLVYLSCNSALDLLWYNFNILWCHPFYLVLFFRKTRRIASIIFLSGILIFTFLYIHASFFSVLLPVLLLLSLWLSIRIFQAKG